MAHDGVTVAFFHITPSFFPWHQIPAKTLEFQALDFIRRNARVELMGLGLFLIHVFMI